MSIGTVYTHEYPVLPVLTTRAFVPIRSDPLFRPWVEKYAKDKKLFFSDFAVAFKKLIELVSRSIYPSIALSASLKLTDVLCCLFCRELGRT